MKKLITLSACVFSLSATASTITYNGYTLDESTNIVTGGGLEWLQWDETVGQSINTALSTYSADGWRLASNSEMAGLFNSFDFGKTFDATEGTLQRVYLPDTLNSFGAANEFITLFGDTYAAGGGSFNYGDPLEYSTAWFGSDLDNDSRYKSAYVLDEHAAAFGGYNSGFTYINKDYYRVDYSAAAIGVSLVRNAPVSNVPLPAAAWLFLSAVAGLTGAKRFSRKK